MSLFQDLLNDLELIRIVYFLAAKGYRSFDVLNFNRENDNEKFLIASSKISTHIANMQVSAFNEVCKINPYFEYLLSHGLVPLEQVILFLLIDKIDLHEMIGEKIEVIPEDASQKYKIVELDSADVLNHEGIVHKDKFYYYTPALLNNERVQSEPTEFIKLILAKHRDNKVHMRIDENLSIPIYKYEPNYRLFHELYFGKIIDIDNLDFPLHASNTTLTVYNPSNMKKIQFKLSTRSDNEKWIEVEELYLVKSLRKFTVTRYLHSIYDEADKNFLHIDGSLNFYSETSYLRRLKTTINAHADKHEKLWLVEGKTTKSDWIRFIYRFFEDFDLISDAFSGKLNEEVLEEIL